MGANRSMIRVEISFSIVSSLNASSGKRGGKLTKLLSAPRVARMTNPAMGRFCPETQFRDWCREPLTPEKEMRGKGKFKLKPKKRKELI